ncbi:MAG: AEC family transporter [Pseudomonadota bacterium]
MSAYFTIIGLIVAGWVLARLRVLPESSPDVLNRFVITLCLPAVILIHVPTLEPSWQLLPLVVIPWLVLAATVLGVLGLSRWLGLRREVTATLLVLIPLGNTSFLGFPLVQALLGDDAIRLAVVYDQFGSFLIVCTHVLFVVGWYGEGENPNWRSMGQKIITFPPFFALVFALLFGKAWMPEPLMLLTHRFADMLLPMVTIAIGLSLQLRLVPDYRRGLWIGLIGKLLVLPALALAMAWAFGAQGDIAVVTVLESAMPPMITAAALLASARLAPALGSALVAWGVVISALTVPFWFWLSMLLFGGSS